MAYRSIAAEIYSRGVQELEFIVLQIFAQAQFEFFKKAQTSELSFSKIEIKQNNRLRQK